MKKTLIAVFILFFAVSSFAAEKVQIRRLGGMNTKVNPHELQDAEATDISNFVFDEAGTLTKRGLFRRYNQTSIGNVRLNNLFKFYKPSDAGYFVCTGGDKIYNISSGTLTDVTTAGLDIVPDSQWNFESFTDGSADLVFAVNNSCRLQSWNGTAAAFSTEGGYPGTNCNLLKKHKARLWAAGSTEYPYRIYYSSLNDGDDWATSGGSMDLPAYEKIIAVEVLSDTLFVFTRTAIYAVVGDTPNEFAIQKTRSAVGTHAPRSVKVSDRVIFFLHKSGVFVFDGDTSTNISENIQPTIDSISSTYINLAAAIYDRRGRYWLSYASTNGTFNDTVLLYDTVVKQWTKLGGVAFSSFYMASEGLDKGELYAGNSSGDGFIWQLQSTEGIDQLVHGTREQLETGVTFNTVISDSPTVSLLSGLDGYAKLVSHFNGDNAAASYRAETGQALTFVGDAKLSTAEKKFGISSLNADGNDYVTVPDSTDWNFGTGPFTIDFWVNFDSLPATNWQYFMGQYSNAGNQCFIALYHTGAEYQFKFYHIISAVINYAWHSVISPSTGAWHHIAVVRDGSNWYMFLDGQSKTVIYEAGNADCDLTDIPSVYYLADEPTGFPNTGLDGYMDEPRISKGITRWTGNFNVMDIPPVVEYQKPVTSGTLISDGLQINAAGQASLGIVKWNSFTPTGTKIQVTTRTGVTNDTVYHRNWETWVSSSTVVHYVTSPTVWIAETGYAPLFSVSSPTAAQARDVVNYETDDSVSASCVQFTVQPKSGNRYMSSVIPIRDLSNYTWLGFWLKSPVTGDSVVLSMGEASEVELSITASTAQENAWEYHYWPLSSYSSTQIDAIQRVRLSYLNNVGGNLYLGDIYAYDFLDNGDTITSTPNDFIQYKMILGSVSGSSAAQVANPQLVTLNGYTIILSYSTTAGSLENSLSSYWKSKVFDLNNNYNKLWQIVDCFMESQNPVTGASVTMDYWLDDDRASGTVSRNIDVTGRTVNTRFYLPSGSYGRTFQFRLKDDNVDSQLKIKQVTIQLIQEGGN